jgi:hypothetical protein
MWPGLKARFRCTGLPGTLIRKLVNILYDFDRIFRYITNASV